MNFWGWGERNPHLSGMGRGGTNGSGSKALCSPAPCYRWSPCKTNRFQSLSFKIKCLDVHFQSCFGDEEGGARRRCSWAWHSVGTPWGWIEGERWDAGDGAGLRPDTGSALIPRLLSACCCPTAAWCIETRKTGRGEGGKGAKKSTQPTARSHKSLQLAALGLCARPPAGPRRAGSSKWRK